MQIGLTDALMHTKGYAAAETKASLDSRAVVDRVGSSIGSHTSTTLIPNPRTLPSRDHYNMSILAAR